MISIDRLQLRNYAQKEWTNFVVIGIRLYSYFSLLYSLELLNYSVSQDVYMKICASIFNEFTLQGEQKECLILQKCKTGQVECANTLYNGLERSIKFPW